MIVGINDLLFLEYWPLFDDDSEPSPVIIQRICTHLEVNAYLLLSRQSSQIEIDPYTGNATQVAIGGAPVRIPCAIRERDRLPREAKTVGIESSQTIIRGYILANPSDLETFDISAQLPIEIQSPVEGSVVNGLIDLDITINPASRRINQVSGIPFTGLMSRIGSGETPEYPV